MVTVRSEAVFRLQMRAALNQRFFSSPSGAVLRQATEYLRYLKARQKALETLSDSSFLPSSSSSSSSSSDAFAAARSNLTLDEYIPRASIDELTTIRAFAEEMSAAARAGFLKEPYWLELARSVPRCELSTANDFVHLLHCLEVCSDVDQMPPEFQLNFSNLVCRGKDTGSLLRQRILMHS